MPTTTLTIRSLRPYFLVCVTATCLFVLAYFAAIENKVWAASVNGTLPPIETIPPLPGKNLAKITVIHAAPFSGVLANTAIDICTDAGSPVADLTGLQYLDNASIFVTPGDFDFKVAAAGTCTPTLVEIDPFSLIDQQEILIIVTGDGTNQPLSVELLVTKAGVRHIFFPFVSKEEEPTAR